MKRCSAVPRLLINILKCFLGSADLGSVGCYKTAFKAATTAFMIIILLRTYSDVLDSEDMIPCFQFSMA